MACNSTTLGRCCGIEIIHLHELVAALQACASV